MSTPFFANSARCLRRSSLRRSVTSQLSRRPVTTSRLALRARHPLSKFVRYAVAPSFRIGKANYVRMHSEVWPVTNEQFMNSNGSVPVRSTTIICVRKGEDVVLMGDGQMTIGSVVAKPNAKKLRKLSGNKVICGFAGAAADGIHLIDLLEKKLSERDELRRACVETTRMWRTDKILRHLNAIIVVADEKSTFELTGNGELVESDSGIIAIGSGGHFAEAAARALYECDLDADEIAAKAMKIAADMCVYTNHNTLKLKMQKGKGIVEDTTNPKKTEEADASAPDTS